MSDAVARVSPPESGGVAAAVRKWCDSHPGAADGVVPKPKRLRVHSDAFRLGKHPVRSAKDADAIPFWSRPPLLTQGNNILDASHLMRYSWAHEDTEDTPERDYILRKSYELRRVPCRYSLGGR